MASLAACIKKLNLTSEDAERAKDLSKQYFADGYNREEADAAAVSDLTKQVRGERVNAVKQIEDAGGIAPTRGQAQFSLDNKPTPTKESKEREASRHKDERFSRGLEGAIREDGRVELTHYSNAPLQETDPRLAGSGADKGVKGRYLPQVTYFGIVSATDNAYTREPMLGKHANIVSVLPSEIYPVDTNPENLWVTGNVEESVSNLQKAGYIGYWATNPELGKAALLLEPMRVEGNPVELYGQVADRPDTVRYIAGISPTEGETVPSNYQMAQAEKEVLATLQKDPHVLSFKAAPSLGLYGGESERSFDYEIVVSKDYNPDKLTKSLAEFGKKHNQFDVFISRVMDQNEKSDNARSGFEAYFAEPKSKAELKVVVDEIMALGLGIDGFTYIADPAGAGYNTGKEAKKFIGVRVQDIPEIGMRWDEDMRAKLTGMSKDQSKNYMAERQKVINKQVAAVEKLASIDMVNKFSYDTVVTGAENYQDYIDGKPAPFGESVQLAIDAAAARYNEVVNFSLDPDQETGKTVTAYKLFKSKKKFPNQLFPLFVDGNTAMPTGVWIDAKMGELNADGKVKSSIGPLAPRGGFHAGTKPVAAHIGGKSAKGINAPDYRPQHHVWAEIQMRADVDWQTEANNRAVPKKDGTMNVGTAHITDQVPTGGFYKYKTNANMIGEWMIGGEMKVIRALSNAEVIELNKDGPQDLPRREGEEEVLFSLEPSINDLGFYSSVEKAVIDMKLPQWKLGKPAGGQEIWQKISKAAGVKKEELKWLGIEEILKSGNKFTREQVIDFIKANGVQITEVRSGGGSERLDWGQPTQQEINGAIRPVWDATGAPLQIIGLDITYGVMVKWDDGRETLVGEYDFLSDAKIESEQYAVQQGYISENGKAGDPKWEEFVAEGEHTNYREIKLTMPDLEGDPFVHDNHFPDDPNIIVFLRVDDRHLETSASPRPSTYSRLNSYHINENQSDLHQAGGKKGYVEKGFGLKVEALRAERDSTQKELDEFVTDLWMKVPKDPERDDLAVAGKVKKKHVDGSSYVENIRVGLQRFSLEVDDVLTGAITKVDLITFSGSRSWERKKKWDLVFDAIDASGVDTTELSKKVKRLPNINSEISKASRGIVDAPFKDNQWMALGMKRAIVDAVSNGYEALSWSDSSTIVGYYGSGSEEYRKAYEQEYDKKLVSMVKKLTGQTPVHMNMDGTLHSDNSVVDTTGWTATPESKSSVDMSEEWYMVHGAQGEVIDGLFANSSKQAIERVALNQSKITDAFREGYWIIPITKELRQSVEGTGFPQFSLARDDDGISTRYPTAAGATEDPIQDNLIVGLDSAKLAPKSFEKNVNLISSYSNSKPAPAGATHNAMAELFIEHVKSNLLWLYDRVPADTRDRSHLWYDGARRIADRWSVQFGVKDTAVAGVLASLSPQKDWFMNVSLAERVLDTFVNHQDTVWSPEMEAAATRVYYSDANKALHTNIRGKSLSELTDNVESAAWIRAYDEAHNPRGHRIISPEGYFHEWATSLKGSRKATGWGSLVEITKAVSVLKDPSMQNISSAMGRAHKVRNFYNNIISPNGEHGDVTIDTHAVGAGLIQPLSGKSTEVAQNLGGTGSAGSTVTGLSGTYPFFAEAYRRAAAERGILPRQMQSITWEAVRGLFTAGYKGQKKNTAFAKAAWEKYKAGDATLDETRSSIHDHASGINEPDWIGSAGEMDDSKPDSSYIEELSGTSTPRDSVSERAGSGRGTGTSTASDTETASGPQLRIADSRQARAKTKFTVERGKAAVAGLKAAVNKKLGVEVIVIHSSDIPPNVARQIPAGTRPKGFAVGNKAYIVADHLDNAQDAQVTMAHELKGHVGVNNIIEDWSAVVELYDALAATGDAEFKAIDTIARHRNKNVPKTQLVKEFIAIAAERKQTVGAVEKFMRKIRALLKAAFKGLGFKPISMTDIDLILTRGEQYLAQGKKGKALVESAPDWMTAWHGTPHLFDKFSLSAMGTGEGAQAYGWGLYFAGKKSIAEWYRDKLSEGSYDIYLNGDKMGFPKTPEEFIAREVAHIKRDPLVMSAIQDGSTTWDEVLTEIVGDAFRVTNAEFKAKGMSLLKGFDVDSVTIKAHGQIYQVDIPEDNELLDWDEPYDAQSDEIQEKLYEVFEGMKPDGFHIDEGGFIEKDVSGRLLYELAAKQQHSPEGASRLFNRHGIKGLLYLDASSRNKSINDIKKEFLAELPEDAEIEEVEELLGQNAFSYTNEAIIKGLMDSDWLGFDFPAQAITAALGKNASNYDLSPKLSTAIADAQSGDTHNYVIWDESAVTIEAVNEEQKQAEFSLDSTDSSILFSLDDNNVFDAPVESRTEAVIRTFQDKFKPVLMTQEEIEKSRGSVLAEEENPYLAEELFYGKTEEDLRVLRETYVRPLAEGLAEYEIDRSELDEWLIANHAAERNKHIRKINPAMPDGGSGMTDTEAARVHNMVTPAKRKQLNELADHVYGMLEHKRQLMRDGLQSDEITDAWEGAYKYYVPLKGLADNEEVSGGNIGKGYDIRGRESMKAMGRSSTAESPVLHAIKDVTESQIRFRKNEVGNVFLQMVENNPNKSYWEVFTNADPDTDRGFVNGMVQDTAVNMLAAKNADGSKKYYATKKGGETIFILIKDERLNRAMQNMGPEPMNKVTQALGTMTRYLSAMSTSYNPEFLVSNVSRDVQTAVMALMAEQDIPNGRAEGKAIALEMLKGMPSAMRAIHASLRGKDLKGEGLKWQEAFNDFREDGAKTGWFDMKEIDQQASDLNAMISVAKGGVKGNARAFAEGVKDMVENANTAVENAVRLSVYRKGVEAGLTRQKAASLAKNLTVNFNRKGEIGAVMNSLYMFSNASIQGTSVFLRAMGTAKLDPDAKSLPVIGKRRLNAAQKVAAGIVAAAFALSVLNRAMAGDDDDGVNWYDKVPNHVRERNVVIMKSIWGGEAGKYTTIPLPYGFNIFYVLGDTAESALSSTYRPMQELATHSVMSMLGSFSPLGFESSDDAAKMAAKTITPTVGKPFMQLAVNENFYGGRIFKENFAFGPQLPDSSLVRKNTKPHWAAVSKFLNEATGGTAFQEGWIDVSPDSLGHLFNFVTGGAGKFASITTGVVEKTILGEELEDREIPFYRKVSGEVQQYGDQSRFYDRAKKIKQIDAEMKTLKGTERKNFRAKNVESVRQVGSLKLAEKQLKEMRKQLQVVELGRLPDNIKEQRSDRIKARMEKVVDKFNLRYDSLRKDAK